MKQLFFVLLILACFLSLAAFSGEKDIVYSDGHEHNSSIIEKEPTPTRALICRCGSALIPSYRYEYMIGTRVPCHVGGSGHKDEKWMRKKYVTNRCPSCGFSTGEQVVHNWAYYQVRCPVYGYTWPC